MKNEGGRGSLENTRGSGRLDRCEGVVSGWVGCEEAVCDGVECLEREGGEGVEEWAGLYA